MNYNVIWLVTSYCSTTEKCVVYCTFPLLKGYLGFNWNFKNYSKKKM